MSLTTHSLHRGELLSISCVCCRPHDGACGALEHSSANRLVLPLNGVFVKHHEGGPDVVAGAGQALFFNRDEGYRVSHPAGLGDDCLVIEPGPRVLRELLARFDAAAAERERRVFGATQTPLPAAAAVQSRLLLRGLRRREIQALEIETRALEIFGATLAGARPSARHDVERRPQARRRRREQAIATAATLLARPEHSWTLDRLSRRVHASPFHLARCFHKELGEPIHRYLVRARLARALEMVLDSDADLTEVALALGFSTPSHFSTSFRKAYGVAPSTLRRQASAKRAAQLRKISKAVQPPTP